MTEKRLADDDAHHATAEPSGSTGTRPDRRQFVGGLVGFGITFAAGCLGGGSGGTDDEDDSESEPDPELVVRDRVLSSAFPVELLEPGVNVADMESQANLEDVVVHLHWHGDWSHWHFAPLEIPEGERRTARVRFVDENYETLPIGAGEPFHVEVELVEGPGEFIEFDLDEDMLELEGQAVGSGQLRFELCHDDEPVWEALPLDTEVIDS